jgi:hypothetical protein
MMKAFSVLFRASTALHGLRKGATQSFLDSFHNWFPSVQLVGVNNMRSALPNTSSSDHDESEEDDRNSILDEVLLRMGVPKSKVSEKR